MSKCLAVAALVTIGASHMILPSVPATSTACHIRRASPLNRAILTRRVLKSHSTRKDIVRRLRERGKIWLLDDVGLDGCSRRHGPSLGGVR